jgi:molybdenum cofactor cytidylyltransferase
VVTGHQRDVVEAALAGLDVRFVHNPLFADGLGTSLAAGVAALPEGLDGVLVALGDMPGVKPSHFDKLISAFAPDENRSICIATHGGKRGNPVLLAAAFFPELRVLTGDSGARSLIGQNPDLIVEVDIASDAVLTDIDTPEALAKIRSSGGD